MRFSLLFWWCDGVADGEWMGSGWGSGWGADGEGGWFCGSWATLSVALPYLNFIKSSSYSSGQLT
ncbi:MAG TPA: hypothetical protein DD000_21010, partial [Cyanobacteria bacterium UBA11166]|nr:hypothetical protein [Cyanobacteria bacterium UBA11166]HBS71131.1 hypothetical protein [Cyanobacteria bacterium UBA11153]